ncbi:MAG: hypothetical protein ACJASR_002209 [Psychroserpens sp.]|jgi:hypothetical protein
MLRNINPIFLEGGQHTSERQYVITSFLSPGRGVSLLQNIQLVSVNLDIDVIEAMLLLANDDQEESEVAIFPNPATDFLFVRTIGLFEVNILIYIIL